MFGHSLSRGPRDCYGVLFAAKRAAGGPVAGWPASIQSPQYHQSGCHIDITRREMTLFRVILNRECHEKHRFPVWHTDCFLN